MTEPRRKKVQAKSEDQDRRERAERIALALDHYNMGRPTKDKVTQRELGELIARRMGKDEPITQSAVGKWMNREDPNTPDYRTLDAIADVLRVDRAWLAWGGTARWD
jgi:transcriptional regulator with XRE-family HTH domain